MLNSYNETNVLPLSLSLKLGSRGTADISATSDQGEALKGLSECVGEKSGSDDSTCGNDN